MPVTPAAQAAEEALIGAVFHDRAHNATIASISHKFGTPLAAKIASRIAALETLDVDIDHVIAGITSEEQLALYKACPNASPSSVAQYERIVDEGWQQRILADAVTGLARTVSSMTANETLHALRGIANSTSGTQITVTNVGDHIDEIGEQHQRLPTGWDDLDHILGSGPSPGQLVVVGARPAVGKSSFALSMAYNWATSGISSLLVSLEMGPPEIAKRLVALHKNMRSDFITEEYVASHPQIRDEISALPIQVWAPPYCTIDGIERAARQSDADALIVDYVGIIRALNDRQPRREQIEEITNRLKCLARETLRPVILLAQCRRSAEGKHPQLSDLKDSGALEQDADIVLLLHRDSVTDPSNPSLEGKGDVIVAKQRDGATGVVPLAFVSVCAKWAPLARTTKDLAWND